MTSQTFVDLSRWQFATTAAFHMTFPALSVGLAIFLVICYGAYCRTGNPLYLQMFRRCHRPARSGASTPGNLTAGSMGGAREVAHRRPSARCGDGGLL